MKKNKYQKTDTRVQSILNQLISEEWMASVMYKQFIVAACCKEESDRIRDLLVEISDDEMDDHYAKLVKYATCNGYSVPCQIKDYEKYASDATVKQFNSWKKDRDAGYYIGEALKAEVEAISSYEKIMGRGDVSYDLLQVLLTNYYDEQEHLQKLTSLGIIYNVGAQYAYNG